MVTVNDEIQHGYTYERVASPGHDFQWEFQPELTPAEMLEVGVFGGHYLNDCRAEFPAAWFKKARLSDHGPDPAFNFFKVAASQPLKVWQQKGWIYEDDPRGWFQWYARYYMGRRLPAEDERQIKRWRAIKRHVAQLRNACKRGDLACRPKQRQALLHWAYDSREI